MTGPKKTVPNNKATRTKDDIKARIESIKATGERDPEAAHADEDDLYKDFIRYVGKVTPGADPELAKKARLVLKTEKIEFPRYYA